MAKLTFFAIFILVNTLGYDANALIVTTAKEKTAEMTAQQRRGQAIYMAGKSPSGQDILARLNNKGASLPATLMPCVNCHQDDGKGTTEAGISPPDIRWSTLSRSYGISGKNGKTFPAYDQRTLRKAISLGIGSGGQSLNPIMPRYQLSHQDMEDLLAFLTGLGSYRISGILDEKIRIGIILDASHSSKTTTSGEDSTTRALARAQAIKRLLYSYFN